MLSKIQIQEQDSTLWFRAVDCAQLLNTQTGHLTNRSYVAHQPIGKCKYIDETSFREAFKTNTKMLTELDKYKAKVLGTHLAPVIAKLYVFRDKSSPGIYKIGVTGRDVTARLKELNAGVSSEIDLLWLTNGLPYARSLEKYLHNYFKLKQVRSEFNPSLQEWFALDEFDLEVLKAVINSHCSHLPGLE